MKAISAVIFALGILFLISGCKQLDDRYPKREGTHVLELYKVRIGAADFGKSLFGKPLKIRIELRENGRNVATSAGSNVISGGRGEQVLRTPVRWVVNFDPQRTYQISVEERGILAKHRTKRTIPAEAKAGFWPFAESNGHLAFGKDSYLEFRDKLAE